MQYVLLFRETEADFAKRQDPADAPAYWGGWYAFLGAMREAGILTHGNGLQPPHAATTVRLKDGQRLVQDGPFADTKEQLGGYVVVEVADLDAALAWAVRAPCAAAGSVEVRPVLPPRAGPPA
jgi:hypothetical protein